MSRSLRPRKQINYAKLGSFEDDDDSANAVVGTSPLSSPGISDNEYAAKTSGTSEDENDELDNAVENSSESAAETPICDARPSKMSKERLPVLPSGSVRAVHVKDHKARSTPLYNRQARVEILSEEPHPFRAGQVASGNVWNTNNIIADDLALAGGHNVGKGPVWELLEDRSWWKESIPVAKNHIETEGTRRPRVYGNVLTPKEFDILDPHYALAYLPKSDASGDALAPPITCTFGSPGGDFRRQVRMFEDIVPAEYSSGTKSHVFCAGSYVTALDWCPIFADDQPCRNFKQYIAVGPLPSRTHSPAVGIRCPHPTPACIQIWSFAEKEAESAGNGEGDDSINSCMKCEMVLCIDCGPSLDLKWCPLPSNDLWADDPGIAKRKLGLLAGVFEDGSLTVFAVPDPVDLPASEDGPIFVHIKPLKTIQLDETSITSLDWANSERIAVGCSNGAVAVYDLKSELSNCSRGDSYPILYVPLHQSAVRSVCWVTSPGVDIGGKIAYDTNPTLLASGGCDGCEMLMDIREGVGYLLNRTRDVIIAMSYGRFGEGIVTLDLENFVKQFLLDPSLFCAGRTMIETPGPIRSVHCSDYHSQLAVGSADGCVWTVNMLQSLRRGPLNSHLNFKIYQMDFNRKTGEYKMLDNLLPSGAVTKQNAARKTANVEPVIGTGAWPPEVSVTCVRWNNGSGLARAPLLASGTASGLCRIDWLLGRFSGGEVPYDGVDNIRQTHDLRNLQEGS